MNKSLHCLLACVTAAMLPARPASAATLALESTVGLEVGSYLVSPPFSNIDETHVAGGASNLSAHQVITLGSPPVSTYVEASTSLTFAGTSHGGFHLDWSNLADIPGGPNIPASGGRVAATLIPASTYNDDVQNKALATYAFAIDGDGAVTVDVQWSSTLNDPQYSSGLQDFLYRGLKLPMFDVFQFRNGQGIGTAGSDPQQIRSTGEIPVVFNGLAGDIFVLHLMPRYDIGQDGGRVHSKLYSVVDMSFAITSPGGAAALPLPSALFVCASGLVSLGAMTRGRRRRPSPVTGSRSV